VGDVDEFDPAERRRRQTALDGPFVARAARQRDTEMIDLHAARRSPAEDREAAEHAGERSHEVERRDDITRHRLRGHVVKLRQVEQNRADDGEEQKVAPVVRDDETHFAPIACFR
jgi:hypothetical protein